MKSLDDAKSIKHSAFKLALFPVFCLTAIFLVYIAIDSGERRYSAEQMGFEALEKILQSQSRDLTNEIFYGLERAVESRLQGIVEEIGTSHPEVQSCILTSVIAGPLKGKSFDYCATDDLKLEQLHGKAVYSLMGENLAHVSYGVGSPYTVWDYFTLKLILTLVFGMAIALLSTWLLVGRLHRAVVLPLLDRVRSSEKLATIGKTSQMLAHDLKKPFSMLEAAMDMMVNAKGKEEFDKLSESLVPEVVRAKRKAFGLLRDIMEVNSPVRSAQLDVSPAEIILSALRESMPGHEGAHLDVQIKFEHRHNIRVDPVKIGRVLENVIQNALNALNGKGKLWVRTLEQTQRNKLKIILGNSGPPIPREVQENLFDAFFSTRSTGTGLGLAIAKKITNDYQGDITFVSNESVGTEFYVTLPLCESLDAKRSLEQDRQDLATEDAHAEDQEDPSGFSGLHRALLTRSRPLRIAILDDEVLYAQALRQKISSLDIAGSELDVQIVTAAKEALSLSERHSVDLYIVDIDLNDPVDDGFSVTKQLRASGFEGVICIHTNRETKQARELSSQVGASFFLEKPMSRAHLVELLLSAVPASAQRRRAIVVDDNIIFRQAWLRQDQFAFEGFSSPEEVLEHWDHISGQDVAFFVLDYAFDNSDMNGLELADLIRDRGIKCPIFICSNYDVDLKGRRNVYEVSKDPQAAMEQIFTQLGSGQT